MKFREFMAELREALTVSTRGSLLKAILLLVAILLVAVGLSLVLNHYLPEEKLEPYAKHGYLAVFLVMFVSSLSIVLPIPGTVVLITAAGMGTWSLPLLALVASVGGALGEISGYLVGYGGRAFIAPEQTERYRIAEGLMQRWGGLAIFAFALVPFLIFDFVGIAAGVFRYPVKKFLLYAWLGRLPRSLIEVYVGKSLLDAIF